MAVKLTCKLEQESLQIQILSQKIKSAEIKLPLYSVQYMQRIN
jgi:hypothetical protein